MDCLGCDPYEKAPDPSDCHSYYLCDGSDGNYDTTFLCPNGDVFDGSTRGCSSTATCNDCPSSCAYQCAQGIPGTVFPTDCSKYFECDSNGDATGKIVSCDASNPYFDGIACQGDESRCCHCQPYCYSSDVGHLIENPQDCRMYYGCTAPGTTDIFNYCSDGQYFDVGEQKCSSTVSCNTQEACRNVVDSDGCIDPYTCLSSGYFPKCPKQCTSEYYYCSGATGAFVGVSSCDTGKVFHPDTHTCVSEDQCPY